MLFTIPFDILSTLPSSTVYDLLDYPANKPSPEKRDYRQLGIGQKPHDDKTTYQDLERFAILWRVPNLKMEQGSDGFAAHSEE
jgi:hypothetical protein